MNAASRQVSSSESKTLSRTHRDASSRWIVSPLLKARLYICCIKRLLSSRGALLWGLLVEAGVRPMTVVLVKALSKTQPPSDPK
jgi:hypothetical protein